MNQKTHRPAEIQDSGVHFKIYDDGSRSLKLVHPEGLRGFGINERLKEERRRAKPGTSAWRLPAVGVSSRASALAFSTAPFVSFGHGSVKDPSYRFYWCIHSDLERGFIRAEVVACQDLLDSGGLGQAKAAHRLRVEGKDYVVQDGDVLNIRFSV